MACLPDGYQGNTWINAVTVAPALKHESCYNANFVVTGDSCDKIGFMITHDFQWRITPNWNFNEYLKKVVVMKYLRKNCFQVSGLLFVLRNIEVCITSLINFSLSM